MQIFIPSPKNINTFFQIYTFYPHIFDTFFQIYTFLSTLFYLGWGFYIRAPPISILISTKKIFKISQTMQKYPCINLNINI
nr:MAG TPA: hypothetical protein [Caudoviricetes sp.]